MTPTVLLILDGFGLSPNVSGNAILSTPTPNFDRLISMYPAISMHASGEAVGLSWGEMGNSEVGHLNLGTGRIIMQDLPRINKTISDDSFFANPELLQAFEFAKKNNGRVHLLGLASSGGVHSHIEHLFALLKFAAKQDFKEIYLHLISDGRDTPEKIFLKDLKKIEAEIEKLKIGKIATIMGRYFAMDRDNHHDRTKKAYDALTTEISLKFATAEEAVNHAYDNRQTDEFIEPAILADTPRIAAKDSVIFFNFRSDRAKQLAEKLIARQDLFFVSFTSYGYEPSPIVKVAFFAPVLEETLAEVVAKADLTQLHIAETEKYAHVTYFFNGGLEKAFAKEERILVPSPKVATYDLKPEMSAEEVASKFCSFFKQKKPAFSVINLANADMVGHTGDFNATKKAIRAVDLALGQIAAEVINQNANLIVTGDHGNAEQMINPQTGEIDKEHTTNPVPMILAFSDKKKAPQTVTVETKIALSAATPVGVLCDVTATVIQSLELKMPKVMTGQSLKDLM